MSAHLRGDIFRGGITQFPEYGELMLIKWGRSSSPKDYAILRVKHGLGPPVL